MKSESGSSKKNRLLKRIELFDAVGVKTIEDLLYYLPHSYSSRDSLQSIASFYAKERFKSYESSQSTSQSFQTQAVLQGKIAKKKESIVGKNKSMLVFTIADGSGYTVDLIFWNRLEYYKKVYSEGQTILIIGKPTFDKRFHQIQFTHPEIEKVESDQELYAKNALLPNYSLSMVMRQIGMTMRTVRSIIEETVSYSIEAEKETIPEYIQVLWELLPQKKVWQNIHIPSSFSDVELGFRSIKFEEIFYFELMIALRKRLVTKESFGRIINPKSPTARTVVNSLPFELTSSQKKVLNEIVADLGTGHPMNRLLQGDVGSGKTIVALLCILCVLDNGCQSIFMAPTEILAEQQYHYFEKYCSQYGVTVALLTGSSKSKKRKEIQDLFSSGTPAILIGTHALFEVEYTFPNVGLIVIDEQHRFGVEQRATLRQKCLVVDGKKNIVPHMLVMSATPIPRTLSLTVFGDLDVSILQNPPRNRKPIVTKIVYESNLQFSYEFIRAEIAKGRQAYIVFPLVEKSEKIRAKSVEEYYELLQETEFSDLRCGLLHGQMKWNEKEATMKAFAANEYDILVCTTVVEVGIDVPNASVMLINNAERFGLSQLHQLRGRVGRGSEQSYCFLATKDISYATNMTEMEFSAKKSLEIRLEAMVDTTDGFKISEIDLELRGPGDILGTRQSGSPHFRITDLVKDVQYIETVRNFAFTLLENDPHLRKPEHEIIRKELQLRFGKDTFIDVA